MKDLVVGVRHRFFFHAPLPRLSGAPANPPAIIKNVFKHFRRLSTQKKFPRVLDWLLNGAHVHMPIAEIRISSLKFIKISEWLYCYDI
jgi:hypothetical protein